MKVLLNHNNFIIVLFVLSFFSHLTGASKSDSKCDPEKLVVYELTFRTFWDREKFPRQYPEWRPPAQWSKVVGFSHSESYELFSMGKTASDGMKEFTELGETELLDKMEKEGVLDGFSAPPIDEGVGKTKGKLFLDGNHTFISLASKLVPSPDWFVGLDSLNLCENGRFVDKVTIEADPLDAGTDNGFTFTSPNWPTVPQGVIFRITNVYPTHPAGSFHYPDIDELPSIASFTLQKEKEYELSEVFHLKTDADGEYWLSADKVNQYSYKVDQGEDQIEEDDEEEEEDESIISIVLQDEKEEEEENVVEEEEDNEEVEEVEEQEQEQEEQQEEQDDVTIDQLQEETNEIIEKIRHGRKKDRGLRGNGIKAFRSSSSSSSGGYHASTGPKDFFRKKYRSGILNEAQDKIYDKDDLYQKILKSYDTRRKNGISETLAKKLKRKKRLRKSRKRKNKSERPPRNCKVSEWSEWGPCSKSCGIGEAARSRKVLKRPKRGGKTCPELAAVKWCGSARNCRESYFDW